MSQAATRSSNTTPESELARHRSPAQVKLETLQKEHERLLREIARKRASRDATERLARDASSALEGRAGPIRVALTSTLKELQGIFGALLGDESRLKKRDKARVRRVYLQLFPELGARTDGSGDASRWGREDDAGESWRGEHAQGARARSSSGDARDRTGDAGYSAVKPGGNEAGALRSLFRRLAVALHPDKVRDVTQCAKLTAVMKEVTCAYESRDLARLLELERTWLASLPHAARDADEDLARRTAELLRANTELRRQLRGLSAELKELKQSIPGSCDRSGERRGARGPIDFGALADQIIEEMRAELSRLEGLRDFSASFLRGDLTIEEFLLGPPLGDDCVDFFERMVAEVLGDMADFDVSERSSRRRRRGRA